MSAECWDGLIKLHEVILTFEINSKVNCLVTTNVVDQMYKMIGYLQPKRSCVGYNELKGRFYGLEVYWSFITYYLNRKYLE